MWISVLIQLWEGSDAYRKRVIHRVNQTYATITRCSLMLFVGETVVERHTSSHSTTYLGEGEPSDVVRRSNANQDQEGRDTLDMASIQSWSQASVLFGGRLPVRRQRLRWLPNTEVVRQGGYQQVSVDDRDWSERLWSGQLRHPPRLPRGLHQHSLTDHRADVLEGEVSALPGLPEPWGSGFGLHGQIRQDQGRHPSPAAWQSSKGAGNPQATSRPCSVSRLQRLSAGVGTLVRPLAPRVAKLGQYPTHSQGIALLLFLGKDLAKI